jgi:hypothetical protein
VTPWELPGLFRIVHRSPRLGGVGVVKRLHEYNRQGQGHDGQNDIHHGCASEFSTFVHNVIVRAKTVEW